MEVPLGFRKARLELQKRTRNYRVVREGFIAGGTHPDDIPGVIKLYERFAQVCYMQQLDSRERAHYDDRYPKFALEIVKRYAVTEPTRRQVMLASKCGLELLDLALWTSSKMPQRASDFEVGLFLPSFYKEGVGALDGGRGGPPRALEI